MSTKHRGSCLCGAVTHEVEGSFDRFFLCHCTHCQKDTRSVHAANIFSSSAMLTWRTGENRITRHTLPSTRPAKSFCATCGSAVPTIQQDGQLLVVPAGSLDSAVTIRPDAHLFVASRADLDRELETVPQFQGLPS